MTRGIRPVTRSDIPALYEICVRTGASGEDATALYEYPDLLGDVFVGPYVELQPEFGFVVADDGEQRAPEGYILGVADSVEFARECESQWWPGRRAAYAGVEVARDSKDAWLLRWVQSPPPIPAFVGRYPSHLHIDLLPSLQGGGWGRRLVETLCDALRRAGSPGVHLGVGADNARAIGFYQHLGFRLIERDEAALWLGLDLD